MFPDQHAELLKVNRTEIKTCYHLKWVQDGGEGCSLSRLNFSCFNSYPLPFIFLPCTPVKNLYGRLLLAFKRWKQGQVTCEGHKEPVQIFRDGVREAKAKPICS